MCWARTKISFFSDCLIHSRKRRHVEFSFFFIALIFLARLFYHISPLSLTPSLSLSLSLPLSHSDSHSLSHTLSHSISHTQTHTHRRTRSPTTRLSLPRSPRLSPRLPAANRRWSSPPRSAISSTLRSGWRRRRCRYGFRKQKQ